MRCAANGWLRSNAQWTVFEALHGASVLDRALTAWLRPGMERGARVLQRWNVHADAVTLLGFALGVAAAVAIACHGYVVGLVLMLASRLCDGLDGALARLTQPTDRGAFLDIALDFLFYASVPLAFALADPAQRALPAATLLAAFIGTGSSFLAFAVFAERRGLRSEAYPRKGLFYLGGLTEATETLICFALMCAWPDAFAWWAYGFAALCAMTIIGRVAAGWRAFA
jgi:phosphatidylglycerophosphate synthase